MNMAISSLDLRALEESSKTFSDGTGVINTPLYGPGEFGESEGSAFLGTYLSCNGCGYVDVWMYLEKECEGWTPTIRFGIQMSERPGDYATLPLGWAGLREVSHWLTPTRYRPTDLREYYPGYRPDVTEMLAGQPCWGTDEDQVLPPYRD